jgi:hypothetical protein
MQNLGTTLPRPRNCCDGWHPSFLSHIEALAGPARSAEQSGFACQISVMLYGFQDARAIRSREPHFEDRI